MLEPKKKPRSRVADVLFGFAMLFVIIGLLWMCEQSEKRITPDESDCIEQLRAMTHRKTNYTEDEVVMYGRCLIDRSE